MRHRPPAYQVLVAEHPGLAVGAVRDRQPVLGLATGLTWLIIAFFFRYSSLASLVAAFFAPLYYLFGDRLKWYAERPVTMALFAMAAPSPLRRRFPRRWMSPAPCVRR